MNAFNTVNLAAACVLTSTKIAEELGISNEKWIYPLGGAGTRDSYDCEDSISTYNCADCSDAVWERPNFYSSPSIERSIDTALQISGLTKEDIDCFDFYSCEPLSFNPFFGLAYSYSIDAFPSCPK